MITFRERFYGLPNPHSGGLYAPLTVGAAKYIHPVDYKVFKKSLEEKVNLAVIKAIHKKELLKAYGKGNTNRKINVSYGDS